MTAAERPPSSPPSSTGGRRRVVVVAEVAAPAARSACADVVAVHADTEDLPTGADPDDLRPRLVRHPGDRGPRRCR